MKKLILLILIVLSGCQVDIKHQQLDKDGNITSETTYSRWGLIPENVALTIKDGEITATTGEQAAQNTAIDRAYKAGMLIGGGM